jgi:probable F420-dependent oxidoreductase
MNHLRLGPIGISLDISDDDSHLEVAGELERLGYSTIWIAGGQLDRLSRIADVITATARVQVAPGIIAPDRYPADQVAALYAELEAEQPGRFVVGLGAPQQAGALSKLGDYLDRLDSADIPVPADRRILAAIGPRKLAMARQRFGGAVPLLVTPAYTAGARKTLGPDRTLVIDQFVVLDSDPARARETARGPLRFLLSGGIRGYRESMMRMGLTEQDVEELSDRLVDTVVVWGDVDAVATRVGQHRAAGADQVQLSVLTGPGGMSGLRAARALADRLLP